MFTVNGRPTGKDLNRQTVITCWLRNLSHILYISYHMEFTLSKHNCFLSLWPNSKCHMKFKYIHGDNKYLVAVYLIATNQINAKTWSKYHAFVLFNVVYYHNKVTNLYKSLSDHVNFQALKKMIFKIFQEMTRTYIINHNTTEYNTAIKKNFWNHFLEM